MRLTISAVLTLAAVVVFAIAAFADINSDVVSLVPLGLALFAASFLDVDRKPSA